MTKHRIALGTLVTIFLTTLVFAQTQHPCAADFPTEAWQTYTRGLLLENFPDDKPILDRLVIHVYLDGNPFSELEDGNRRLVISCGLIKLLTEGEYRAAMILEMWHIKLHHRPPAKRVSPYEEVDDFEAMEEQYAAVDPLTVATLRERGYNTCDIYHAIDKAFGFYRPYMDADSPKYQINVNRLDFLRKRCQDQSLAGRVSAAIQQPKRPQ